MNITRILALSAFMIAPSFAAEAREPRERPGCAERHVIVNHLKNKYGEKLAGAGRQNAESMLELYVSEKGTWTIIITRRDGSSCPVAVGEDWRQLDLKTIVSKADQA